VGFGVSRRFWFFITSLGIIAILGVIFVGLWRAGFTPSVLREWIYLREASLNGAPVREPAEFDFFVVGHLYGSPHQADQLPARLLLERLPEIIAAEPEFMVSLGDMVYQKSELDFANLETTFLKKLPFPLYNSPGNHDVGNNRSLYEAYFGKETYFAKTHGPAFLIFLDTERVECGLDQPQITMLKQNLAKAIADSETRFIFVFMHKTLVFQNAEMRSIKSVQAGPNVWNCQKKVAANPLMETIFKPAAAHKPIIIFAGDVGAWGNLSPYYQRDPWLPLTLVMTGLGDTAQDNIIRVHVSPNFLRMDALLLEDMRSVSLPAYDQAYWLKIARSGDPQN
jgi:hypothetical protein